MKKAYSVFLVIIILFNVMGYYGLFLGLTFKNTHDMLRRLDADAYRDTETVTIKVPLAVPYLMNTDFERVNGEVEFQGGFYRLVKQRFVHDTLYIVCIKDIAGKRIKQALAGYVSTFGHQPGEGKHTTCTIPAFIKDYLPSACHLVPVSKGWITFLTFHQPREQESLFLLNVPYTPPKG
jgi:hypothetical protein